MSRDVCGICWCPYDDDGRCGCKPQGPVIGLDVYLDPDDGLKPKLYADRQRHKDEALLKQALVALENCSGLTREDATRRVAAITAIEERLK